MKKGKNKQIINVTVNVLPFGNYELRYTFGGPIEKEKDPFPEYSMPRTTNSTGIQILYAGVDTYTVPKNTGG